MSKLADVLTPPASTTLTTEAPPTHEEIAIRAYEIFVDRGCDAGHDVEDWLQAERELLEAYTKPAPMAKARAV